MNRDISQILIQWPFKSDSFQVRTIVGESDRELIQVRLDLGMIQMEIEGRPDGERPDGFESLLDRHVHLAAEAAVNKRPYTIDAEDCALLMREGNQYYYRYYAAFHLDRFEIVVRDTERNLRLFDFVRQYAIRKRDKIQFDQFRPYVTMMRSRAIAARFLQGEDYESALKSIDDGITAIREVLPQSEEGEETSCSELDFLVRWRRKLEKDRPRAPVDELRQQLEIAVADEDYEEAAKLRDQIQRLQSD